MYDFTLKTLLNWAFVIYEILKYVCASLFVYVPVSLPLDKISAGHNLLLICVFPVFWDRCPYAAC